MKGSENCFVTNAYVISPTPLVLIAAEVHVINVNPVMDGFRWGPLDSLWARLYLIKTRSVDKVRDFVCDKIYFVTAFRNQFVPITHTY